MIQFEYGCPGSLMETTSILRNNPEAVLLAGGTDILVRIKQGMIQPAMLVDIKSITELHGISSIEQNGLRIGALTTLTELVENDLIRNRCPVLSAAALSMACVQVRNRATIGGNVANASPAADTVPPLMAFDAELEIFADEDIKRVPIGEFFTAPGETVLQENEILTAILIPDTARKAHYIKHTLREAMDIAGVGVCVSRKTQGAPDPRVVLGAVAPTPIRVPAAEQFLSEGKIEEACAAAVDAARPIDDVRASASYRKDVIYPLVKRASYAVFAR
ncbi:hypothetical protein CEE37_01505 [candidate division LCP-89 bacterium B3_LCP]|uniref:FAD-binding PCMH-type domain-containing protein n=1 Tax=candidate division LCP-89 bacterium B3_LCP TaxID=2012998 RepID=A0A532V5A4_UNCL8|nr:MAG: hypothetical protein CEE37_01505 [candidate division LCP-89 bacterium B3_LCP]